ncbi:MAG: hypothetical protein ACOVK6_05385 [Ramlibacter sp.]
MHPRLAAVLICLCGHAVASVASTDGVPHGAHLAPRVAPAATKAQATREPPVPAGTQAQAQNGARRAPATAPAPADTAQRERGLMLAGLALMVGIALRRLGAGAP